MLDFKAMRRAMKGADVLFHTVGFVGSNPAELVWRMNAHAPVVAVEAAAAEGLERVVLTSTISAIGPATDGQPANELTEYPRDWLGLAYPDSKHEGELAALDAGDRHGIEVVVVNPAYLLGVPVDREQPGETSTRTVGNYLRSRLPGVIDAPMNFADVADAAQGHLLAADKGVGGRALHPRRREPELARADRARRRGLRPPPPRARAAARDRARGADPRGHEAAVGAARRGLRADVQGLALLLREGQARARLQTRPIDETIRATVEWYRDLIDAGAFHDEVSSSMSTVAGAVGQAARVRAPAPAAARRAPRPAARGRGCLMALPPPDPGTTCLITGASSGIGAEIARELAARGLGVTLVARREERLRELADEITEATASRPRSSRATSPTSAAARSLLAEVEQRGLTVEVLVNNAGFGSGGRFTKLDAAKETSMVRTNARRSSRSRATTCPRWPRAAAAPCSTSPR